MALLSLLLICFISMYSHVLLYIMYIFVYCYICYHTFCYSILIAKSYEPIFKWKGLRLLLINDCSIHKLMTAQIAKEIIFLGVLGI